MSSKFTYNDILRIQNKGLKVNLSAPINKNREVEVISNGKTETVKIRKKMSHEESELQQNCVNMFRLIYPRMKMRLFSIPNEGARNAITASIMVKMGMLHGTSDLILAVPNNRFGAMFIEIKTDTGRLSPYQESFINEMSSDYYCCVIRSVEEFLREVKQYMELT